jgi:arabinan endo-1,5-alpha-L-arabinosidase
MPHYPKPTNNRKGKTFNMKHSFIQYCAAASALFLAIANAPADPLPFYGNYYLHDPGTMVKDGYSYFIYGDGNGIGGITSTDLRNWSQVTPVFPSGPPSWTTNSIPGGTPNYFWAPDTAWFNGLWHMYYSYSQWGTINSVIGVATSPSLVNPSWSDRGKVVKSYSPGTADTDSTGYNCIDPSICVAADGTVWMSYGSYSSGILVTQIDPATGMRVYANSIGTQVANNASGGGWGSSEEGSCIYQNGGYWYLFVNWGGCCNGIYSTYNIRVGRATSPTGPYYDQNGVDLNNGGGTMFLPDTGRYIGPGHPGIMNDNGTYWFTYHYYDALNNGAPTLACEHLNWSNGWPVPDNGPTWYNIQNRTSGLVIDNTGSTTAGSSMAQWTAGTSHNLGWQLMPVGSGSGLYYIQNQTSSMYLDGFGYTTNGSPVKQWNLSTSPNQQWSLSFTDSGYFNILNKASGLCLNGGGLTSAGSPLTQWSTINSYNLQCKFVQVSAPSSPGSVTSSSSTHTYYYYMQNRTSGLVIDSKGSTSVGSQVGQYAKVNSANLRWQLVASDSGYYYIQNQTTGLYLDGGGATANGSAVKEWSYVSSANLQWQPVASDSGNYYIKNRATGMYLDGGGATANGAALKQWSYVNSSNLQWSFQ